MLLFFDLGTGEILLILLVLFVVVGPRQLPEVARTVGKAINEMKRASAGFKNEIQKEAMRLEREAGLNELKKTFTNVASHAEAASTSDRPKNEIVPSELDDTGVIPFGASTNHSVAQNVTNSNKT